MTSALAREDTAGTPSATGSAPRVSVVVCAYTEERWEDLVAAIDSLERQTLPPAELILVVDHNRRLAERAKVAFTEVRVVENSRERGLSGARNSGVTATSGDIVVFIDDDARAAPDLLERLVAGYRPGVLGVGGAAEPAWPAGRPAWFPPEFDWVVGCTYRGLPAAGGAVRNPIGANMSLRREVLDATGEFSAGIGRLGKLPLGCEETDLCIRASAHFPGQVFLFDPAAQVTHRVTTDRTRLRYFVSRCFAEGRSKAAVAARTGEGPALASERSYTLRALPRGVLRGIADALRGDATGLARAAAIVAGLAITTAGYFDGRLRSHAHG